MLSTVHKYSSFSILFFLIAQAADRQTVDLTVVVLGHEVIGVVQVVNVGF